MWIEMAACTSLPEWCAWSGPASEAYRESTGELRCPKCPSPVKTWKADQAKQMASLLEEQQAIRAAWWTQHQAKEAALTRERIASDYAKMRGRVHADVSERHGGGKYEREERQHFQELVKRYRREGDQ